VLDNARDAEQVRPLLPGSPGCVAVVTSRRVLSGLIATDGARPMTLGLFTELEARALLEGRLGRHRLAAEPHPVSEIIRRCAGLPLALVIVAARAAIRKDHGLAGLTAEMCNADPLDPFDCGDSAADIRTVLSWSYHALSGPAAQLFRLLGLHPGTEISVAAVASLAALTGAEARFRLTELVRAHLVIELGPGRFVLHDLLRAYAQEQAHAVDPQPERTAAARRLFDHYLHTAYAGDRLLYPHRDPITLPGREPGAEPERLAGSGPAKEWFNAEHDVLLVVVGWAARPTEQAAVMADGVWRLAWSLTTYFTLIGDWHEQVAAQTVALTAARTQADRPGQAHVHRQLGRAHSQLGCCDDARLHLQRALELFAELQDRPNQAQVHINLARVLETEGRHDEAIDHDERSLDLYREAGHLAGQARALNNLGWMYAQRANGDPTDLAYGETLCRESLSLHERLGNRHGTATAWETLGFVHQRAGRHEPAADCYLRAVAMFRAFGDHNLQAQTLRYLGETYAAAGRREAAREAWQDALRLLEPVHHPDADVVRQRLRDLGFPCPAPAAPVLHR
jgi:tetratricopeptide (TPR) repeat protein